ncbi:MAG: hypothetical protein WKF91_18855 [Segetibacter sp.]
MKEYFIVKRIAGPYHFFSHASTVRKNEPPIIIWIDTIEGAYRHDSYSQALETIKAIAVENEVYQIDKLFIKA